MKTWHENNEFWEKMSPKLFSNQYWTSAPEEVEQIISLLEISPGTKILDLCCGPGRHSLEFTRKGFTVTGVDRTASYLEKAKNAAQNENLKIDFVQADMREFVKKSAFDFILSLYTSLGYFEDPAQNQKVLNNCYHTLKSGGKIIVDVMGKEVLARIFRERDWYEQDDILFLEDRKISKNWSWVDSRWLMIDGSEKYEQTLSHWLYSANELEAMLKEAGFNSVEIYGSFVGSNYDHSAQRLIVVGEK